MKLTKLSAAWLPEWTCRLMPAPAGSNAGIASQLICRVRRTDRRWEVQRFRVAIGVVAAWFLVTGSAAVTVASEQRQTGFFLVAAEASSAASLPAPGDEQRIVPYDSRLLREAEPTRYLLLATKADVPLILAKRPDLQEKGENGFPELQVELTPEAARKLEKLSREHLGERVAFVVDDEPVTLHTIRSVISDGKFRLSRCTDKACQYIYGRLTTRR